MHLDHCIQSLQNSMPSLQLFCRCPHRITSALFTVLQVAQNRWSVYAYNRQLTGPEMLHKTKQSFRYVSYKKTSSAVQSLTSMKKWLYPWLQPYGYIHGFNHMYIPIIVCACYCILELPFSAKPKRLHNTLSEVPQAASLSKHAKAYKVG